MEITKHPFFTWKKWTGRDGMNMNIPDADTTAVHALTRLQKLISDPEMGRLYDHVYPLTLGEFSQRREFAERREKIQTGANLDRISEEVSDGGVDQPGVPPTKKFSDNSQQSFGRPDGPSTKTEPRNNVPIDGPQDDGDDEHKIDEVRQSAKVRKTATVTDVEDDESLLNRHGDTWSLADEDLSSKGQEFPSPTPESSNEKQPHWRQQQSVTVVGRHNAVAKRFVEVSQDLIWDFIPKEGSVLVHYISKIIWGSLDNILKVRSLL